MNRCQITPILKSAHIWIFAAIIICRTTAQNTYLVHHMSQLCFLWSSRCTKLFDIGCTGADYHAWLVYSNNIARIRAHYLFRRISWTIVKAYINHDQVLNDAPKTKKKKEKKQTNISQSCSCRVQVYEPTAVGTSTSGSLLMLKADESLRIRRTIRLRINTQDRPPWQSM